MDLYDTSLPVIEIEEGLLHKKYKQIGFGKESGVYKYDEKTALKIFQFFENKSRLPLKFQKIEVFGQFQDDNFCFTRGLVGFETKQKEGISLELVDKHPKFQDFDKLQFLRDKKKILELVMKADKAIRRIHEKGFIIGDIKGDNMLIDKDENVKFVDVDNYAYGDFGFDLEPGRAKWLSRAFDNKDFSPIDSDKYVFAMMALQYFVDGTVLRLNANEYYFRRLIELLDVDPVIKEGLRLIFSDAHDKPYIGDVLKDFNPEGKILSMRAVYEVNKIFRY